MGERMLPKDGPLPVLYKKRNMRLPKLKSGHSLRHSKTFDNTKSQGNSQLPSWAKLPLKSCPQLPAQNVAAEDRKTVLQKAHSSDIVAAKRGQDAFPWPSLPHRMKVVGDNHMTSGLASIIPLDG